MFAIKELQKEKASKNKKVLNEENHDKEVKTVKEDKKFKIPVEKKQDVTDNELLAEINKDVEEAIVKPKNKKSNVKREKVVRAVPLDYGDENMPEELEDQIKYYEKLAKGN